ncbi:hypothetical protein UlMin_022056 [Ulmus minor]
MSRLTSQIVLCFVILNCWGCVFGINSGAGQPKLRCLQAEREALLNIKEDIRGYREENLKSVAAEEFKNVVFSSWGNEEDKRECCNWIGIRCAKNSGHVIRLDLSPPTMGYHKYEDGYLVGNVSSSLVNLRYLNYLDLSSISLQGIPSVIGNLTKLKYLNLSSTYVHGEIPPQFANLSSLLVLDLGDSYLSAKSLDWLSQFSSLKHLDLSNSNLSQVNDWMQIISKLPSLTHLDLGYSNLPDIIPPSLSFLNSSSSLTFLDLSQNDFSVSSCQWLSQFSTLKHLVLSGSNLSQVNDWMQIISKLPSLTHLDLGHSYLSDIIPPSLSFLNSSSSLTFLDLSWTSLSVSFYQWLFNSSTNSLVHLDLSGNRLQHSILEAFRSMTSLEYVDLSYNYFEGSISEVFCNMTALAYLDLSYNMIGGEFPKCIGNITTLRTLSLRYSRLRGYIPESIGQLSELEKLDISKNSLEGVISETLFSNLSKLSYLDLSFNSHLALHVPFDWIPPFQLSSIRLGDCKMGPQFPKWLRTQKNYSDLDISNVGISDFIPSWFWDVSTQFTYLNLSNNQIRGTIHNHSSDFFDSNLIDLSSNQFEGPIPVFLFKVPFLHLAGNRFSKLDSLCDVVDDSFLEFLDISFNQLSGELPDCWSHFPELVILRLTNNNLSGRIPISFGSLTRIESLHLGENNLNQELPSSLKNCTELRVLDMEENKLLGPIPTWIGENLSALVILILRSNNFYGSIPSSLCSLSHLQLLDLSSNNLSGRISKCFSNFTSMKEIGSLDPAIFIKNMPVEFDFDEAQFIWKGKLQKYRSTLGLVKNIDLSSNKLMGEIPEEITELIGLVTLNLSRNNLSGHIPFRIGRLKQLDALDLSNNKFSGVIPLSLSEVDRLSTLDLSSNNLSGKIPTSTQLQSFDATCYIRNPQLCGAPLVKCPGEEHETFVANKESTEEEGQDGLITKGFYVSATLGFVTAFWGVCGSLLLIKSWRHAYFKLLNEVQDWVYVMVAVKKAKLTRMIRS